MSTRTSPFVFDSKEDELETRSEQLEMYSVGIKVRGEAESDYSAFTWLRSRIAELEAEIAAEEVQSEEGA